MSNFCSRRRILLFDMWFRIRISNPFHLATQIVSIQNLQNLKTQKTHAQTWFLFLLYEVKLCRLCWLQVNKEVAQSVFWWFIQQDVGRWYKWILFIPESRIENFLLRSKEDYWNQTAESTLLHENHFSKCPPWFAMHL